MNARLSLVLGSCLGATVANAQEPPDPFVERGGRLVIEIESEAAVGDWLEASDIDGYTGESYYVWNGTNNFGASTAPDGDPIAYHFRVTTPGNYQLRWRSRNTIGLDGTEHNDSWVRFSTGRDVEGEHPLGGWTKVYMGQVAQWTWDAYTVDGQSRPVRRHFEAGDHVMEIAGRSNGHALDRIALFRYEETSFSVDEFDALSPSPRASRASSGAHVYAGGSCVDDTLSLSAGRSTSLVDGAPIDAGDTLRFDGGDAHAIVEFELDRVPLDVRSTALQLGPVGDSLAVDVYLAGNGDWSASGDFPDPTVRLGGTDAQTEPTTIRSVPLDETLLPRDTVSLVLVGTRAELQGVHDIGTPLEPRLSVGVAPGFCGNLDAPSGGDGSDPYEGDGGGGSATTGGETSEPPVEEGDGGGATVDGGETGDVPPVGGTDTDPQEPPAEPIDTDEDEDDGRTAGRRGGSGGGAAFGLLLLGSMMLRSRGARRPVDRSA